MSTTTIQVFHLPDLGEGLTEAELVQWLVQVGDEIRTDQAIAEVETAKSVVELPSPFAGIVTALHGEPGEAIAVGSAVLEVALSAPSKARAGAPPVEVAQIAGSVGPDATISDPSTRDAGVGDAEKRAHRAEERAGGSGNVLIGYGTKERASAGRRRPRAVPAQGSGAVPATGSGAVPLPESPNAPDAVMRPASAVEHPADSSSHRAVDDGAHAQEPVAVRSPLVRRLARELGIDVRSITGTGNDGAITRGDVVRAAVDNAIHGLASAAPTSMPSAMGGSTPGSAVPEPAPASSTPAASAPAASAPRLEPATPADAPATPADAPSPADATVVDGLAVTSRERLSPLRKAVSAKLTRSRSEIPEATVWVDVDATRLWQLRAELASDGRRAPSLTALVARFVLIALAEHPLLASRLSDAADEIISFDGVNLGVAADTDRGLLVPVIPRAHELSLDALDAQLRELAETARTAGMPPERLRGSTFTLNNYGGLGVDGSAAIINHPDVAILGIGRMIERPWVVDGEIVARRIAQLSLVFDHRVCDGGYAAGFLRRLVALIEHPLSTYGRI